MRIYKSPTRWCFFTKLKMGSPLALSLLVLVCTTNGNAFPLQLVKRLSAQIRTSIPTPQNSQFSVGIEVPQMAVSSSSFSLLFSSTFGEMGSLVAHRHVQLLVRKPLWQPYSVSNLIYT